MKGFLPLTALLLVGSILASSGSAGAQNFVVNGELDTDLSGWTATSNVDWLDDDHDACGGSGSARFGLGLEASEGIHQPIPWSAGDPRFWARFRYRARPTPPPLSFGSGRGAAVGVGAAGLLSLRVVSHAASDCSGSGTSNVSFPLAIEDFLDWTEVALTTGSSFPAGTHCLRLSLSWTWQGGPVTDVEVDGIELSNRFPVFFGDFELDATASTCRWSGAVGALGEE